MTDDDITRLDAEDVVVQVLADAGLTGGEFNTWYESAEAQHRARFLQLISAEVQREFGQAAHSERLGARDGVQALGNDSCVRNRVRERLPIDLGMLVNADLALGPGGGDFTHEDFEQLIRTRMTAILDEAFAMDPSLQLGDLYLFRREEHASSSAPERRGEELRHINVKHAVAARLKVRGGEDEGRAEASASFVKYGTELERYLEDCGTSINLEGHLDDEPVCWPPREEEAEESGSPARPAQGRNSAGVYAHYNPKRIFKTPMGDDKFGNYDEFLLKAVAKIIPTVKTRPVELRHFMEGIDVDFLQNSRRGTVAHLFMVRWREPGNDLNPQHRRMIQRLLVRLCGFYAAAMADLEAKRSERQRSLMQRHAQDAIKERNKLRSASQSLGKISKELQQSISDIAELIEDNFFLSRFDEWLREIRPLFKLIGRFSSPIRRGPRDITQSGGRHSSRRPYGFSRNRIPPTSGATLRSRPNSPGRSCMSKRMTSSSGKTKR